MSALSKRLDKISGATMMQKYERIIPDKGESNDEAIRRHGFEPDHPDYCYMIIEFVTPEEVRRASA